MLIRKWAFPDERDQQSAISNQQKTFQVNKLDWRLNADGGQLRPKISDFRMHTNYLNLREQVILVTAGMKFPGFSREKVVSILGIALTYFRRPWE